MAGPPGLGIGKGLVLNLTDRARKASFEADKDGDEPTQTRTFKKLKTIVIDPGHGGHNQGALGVVDVHEKYLTMELAYALRDELQRTYPDVRVVLTRYWDEEMSLNARAHMANRVDADVFLSLHYNAAPHPRAVGIETYYLATEKVIANPKEVRGKPLASARPTTSGMPEDEDSPLLGTYDEVSIVTERAQDRMLQHERSAMLAELVQRNMLKELKGARNRGVKQANFGVLRGALMPAVVVEGGFLSHPKEGKTVARSKHKRRLVRGLVNAIVAFDDALATQTENEGGRAPTNHEHAEGHTH